MRTGSDNLKSVLQGSFSRRLIIDSFTGVNRTRRDLDPETWEISWDINAEITGGSTVTIVYSDEIASSVSPEDFGGILAPFGQELNLLLEVSAGGFSETVQLARHRIVKVPDARDEHFDLLGQKYTTGSRISLELMDRTIGTRRRGFRVEENPKLTTCWDEIVRLTGMQVLRSLPDKAIPAGVVYQAAEGGRLKAVTALMAVLGGTPYVTSEGALTALPSTWGTTAATLEIGDNGTVIDVGTAMDSEGLYNVVVGDYEDADRNPVHVEAEVTTGPLAATGTFGEYTYYDTGRTVTGRAEAQTIVNTLRDQLAAGQSYRVPIQCNLNPLLEIGDVVNYPLRNGTVRTGRIATMKVNNGATMTLTLDAYRNVA